MKIDGVESRKLFIKSGRRVATWARANGFDTAHMHHVLSGNVQATPEELNALTRDGLVVWKREEKKAA